MAAVLTAALLGLSAAGCAALVVFAVTASAATTLAAAVGCGVVGAAIGYGLGASGVITMRDPSGVRREALQRAAGAAWMATARGAWWPTNGAPVAVNGTVALCASGLAWVRDDATTAPLGVGRVWMYSGTADDLATSRRVAQGAIEVAGWIQPLSAGGSSASAQWLTPEHHIVVLERADGVLGVSFDQPLPEPEALARAGVDVTRVGSSAERDRLLGWVNVPTAPTS